MTRTEEQQRADWYRAMAIANALQAAGAVTDRTNAEAIGAEWVDAQNAVATHLDAYGAALDARPDAAYGILTVAGENLAIFEREEDAEPFSSATELRAYATMVRDALAGLGDDKPDTRRYSALLALERIRIRAQVAAEPDT